MPLARHTMYTRIFNALALPLDGEILGISGLKYFEGSKNFTPKQKVIANTARITRADYPEVNILSLPYADNTFDVVIADQVIEHIEGNPEQAMHEIHRVLKPEGTAIVTSVLLYPIHWGPKDLWRFTPDGLRHLCRMFSDIRTADSWGTKWIVALALIYPRIGDWRVTKKPWNIASHLANRNDKKYPWATWIIARK